MSTTLNFGRDSQGYNAYAPFTSNDKWQATLTNGAETHITLPANSAKWVVVFSFQPGSTVWVDLTGATAVVPGSGTLTSCTAELLPGTRSMNAINTNGTAGKISMITSNTTADVGVMLYAVQG